MKYLSSSITEDLIFEFYRDAIISDHSLPFEGFTQDHRDAYLRLKTRGVRPADCTFSNPSPLIGGKDGEEAKSSVQIDVLHAMVSKMDQKVILSSNYTDAKVRELRDLVEILTGNMNDSLGRLDEDYENKWTVQKKLEERTEVL